MKTKLFFILVTILLMGCKPVNHPNNSTEMLGDTIPKTILSHSDIDQLDEIFNKFNPKLDTLKEGVVYVISSQDELNNLCPDDIKDPNIDFSNNYIVYTYVVRPSISDQLLGVDMMYNQNNGLDFIVTFQECTNCYTAIWDVYPYGVYSEVHTQDTITLQLVIL